MEVDTALQHAIAYVASARATPSLARKERITSSVPRTVSLLVAVGGTAEHHQARTSRRQSPLGPPEYPENESVKPAGVESHASYQVKTGHPGSVYCCRDIFHRALDHLRVPFRH